MISLLYLRRQVKELFFLLLLLSTPLQADWNQDFDHQTKLLTEEIPSFKSPEYINQYAFFMKARETLLHDQEVQKKIAATDEGTKIIFLEKDKNLVLKKRRNQHIHELYAWELSLLLGSLEFFVPSFPVEIDGKRVIVQKLEPFAYGKGRGEIHTDKNLRKVTLETYWKAHIQAYLLGHCDLAGRNIGISPDGKIRFFDNESCLTYRNIPTRNEFTFSSCFISQSLDWPHYRRPIDEKTAKELETFVQSFSDVEKQIHIYMKNRSMSLNEPGFLYRLERIRSFKIAPGSTFRDLYGALFPRMSPGLDELNRIVEKIIKQPVEHGTALFFITRKMKKYTLSLEDKAEIQRWIDTYI